MCVLMDSAPLPLPLRATAPTPRGSDNPTEPSVTAYPLLSFERVRSPLRLIPVPPTGITSPQVIVLLRFCPDLRAYRGRSTPLYAMGE